MSIKQRLLELADVLRSIPVLESIVPSDKFEMLASVVEETVFEEGDEICVEGDDEGVIFIVYEGECAYSNEYGEDFWLQKGEWIGEEQLLRHAPASMTVTVRSEVARILTLDSESLSIAVEEAQLFGSKNWHSEADSQDSQVDNTMSTLKGFSVSKDGQDTTQSPHLFKEHCIHRCEVIGPLGEGSFGLVMLLRDKETRREYALNAMSKANLAEVKREDMVANEKNLMMRISSDFVINLFGSYEDSNFWFFMCDIATGGELFDVYMKLTDMGISKLVVGQTYTICGTADYFAPEIL